ncbi:hypothetical protein [Vibrio methylphosphonaticus]|uniref:hypothetical protein n=1 Tax=Vibrio methylphosphonaticus TaxID=2946866 RepID=UPI00202A5962|nr:hypothetical protein [Vibrio methylphosphonaticus]MCL9777228.1 hypothetical protein [Vibrio methylphosphonaticus]
MNYKHILIPLMSGMMFACGQGSDEDSSSTPPVHGKNCITIESNQLCTASSIDAQSGQRIAIEVSGILPEGYSLNWSTEQVDGVKTPLIYSQDYTGYVVLPRVPTDTGLSVSVTAVKEANDGASELKTVINVSDREALILNGITSVRLNTDGNLYVNWLPAITSDGQIYDGTSYTLSVTRFQDGEPTPDISEVTTLNTYEEVPVRLGETYRLLLKAIDSSGVDSYADHMDFMVPSTLPQLREVQTIQAFSLPDADDFEENTLLEIDNELYIVRVNDEDQSKIITLALEQDIFLEEAPLVIQTRLKELTEEEKKAFSSLDLVANYDGNTTVSFESFDITFNPTNSTFAEAKSGGPTQCLKYTTSAGEVSACLDPETTMSCDVKSEISSSPKTTQICKGAFGAQFTGAIKGEIKGDLYWPGSAIKTTVKTGSPYFGGELDNEYGLRAGIKTAFDFGTVEVGTGFRSYQTFTSTFNNEIRRLIPRMSMDIDLGTSKVIQKLPEKDSWWWLSFPSKDGNKYSMKGAISLGVFPITKLGDSIKIEGAFAGRGNINQDIGSIPGMELVFPPVVGAKIFIDPHLEAKVILTLPWSGEFEYEGKFLTDDKYHISLYKHPEKIRLDFDSSRVCTGNYKYNGEYPVDAVPEYGSLQPGDRYGQGWRINEEIAFPYLGTFRLVDFKISGDGAQFVKNDLVVNEKGGSVSSEYDTKYNLPERSFVRMYHLVNKESWAGLMFPTYVASEASMNYGPTDYPWVCWGNAYYPEVETEDFNMKLEDALWISD